MRGENRSTIKMNDFKFEPVDEAPTFQPSESEFRDPLGYINQIRPIAEKFGICKIIPPKNWKPAFSIDKNSFKFTPRIQRLNELEANTRIRLNFLEKLSKFWDLQLVNQMGGYDDLTKTKKWSQLSKTMKFKDSGTARILKMNYEKILYPYLIFQGVYLPLADSSSHENDDENSMNTENNQISDDNKKSDENPKRRASSKAKTKQKSKSKTIDEKKIESIRCLTCNRGDDEAFMLLCDGCDDSYHTYCLCTPLKEIPKGDWRCPTCIAAICKNPTDVYGFEQSPHEYTLNEFGEKAAKFKNDYFKRTGKHVSCQEVEAEFWRILSSPDESVVVEYGADLHTLETGSGFPTNSNKGKFQPNANEYVTSPWNLNNLSQLDKSVLSQMNVEISGMKIPWAYVGMCFSCFCWHVEDHWSYSINYLHFGEPKTWYGVSGNSAESFETAMKQNANELFEKSPDLLHHLVTIMNPNILKKFGVPIFKLDQREGEFVVTFPRAYHAGFNQGFNFAEAVNFCPADWLPIGRAAIESYKLVKRHTVFAHDELVCKLACTKENLDIDTAIVVQQELGAVINYEGQYRMNLMDKNNLKSIQVDFDNLNDDDRTCCYCKTTCYVSAVKCSCKPDELTCLSHIDKICTKGFKPQKGPNKSQQHQRTIMYKYTLEELRNMRKKLQKRTDEYTQWQKQVRSILNLTYTVENENSSQQMDQDDIVPLIICKPKIDVLHKLYDQALERRYPRYSDSNLFYRLEDELNKAMNCNKTVMKFLDMYRFKRHSELAQTPDSAIDDDSDDIIIIDNKPGSFIKRKTTLDDLKVVISELGSLKCELNDQELFLSLIQEAIDYENKIIALINDWNIKDTVSCSPSALQKILSYIENLDIEYSFKLLQNLRLLNQQVIWSQKVDAAGKNQANLSIKLLRSFVDECVSGNLLMMIPPLNPNQVKCKQTLQATLADLQELLSIAETWDEKAKLKLDIKGNNIKLEELEKFLNEAKCIPVLMENVKKLDDLVKESHKICEDAESALKAPAHYTDMADILKRSKHLPVKLAQIQPIVAKVNMINEWNNQLSGLFFGSAVSEDKLSLIKLLTPRTDLANIATKIQNQISLTTESSNNTKQTQSGGNNKKLKINRSSTNLQNEEQIENINELYSKENTILHIKEIYKTLEIKEIENIKKIRKLNLERLCQFKTDPSLIKCCSCQKSIQNGNFKNCFLCSGIFHNSCKEANKVRSSRTQTEKDSNQPLCSSCERSKRPSYESVVELLVSFENLNSRCSEGDAFQLFIHRIQNLKDKMNKIINNLTEQIDFKKLSSHSRQIKSTENNQNLVQEFFKIYNQIPLISRTQLLDSYIEALLIESDLYGECSDLIDIFYVLNTYSNSDDQGSPIDLIESIRNKLGSDQEKSSSNDSATPLQTTPKNNPKTITTNSNEKQKSNDKTEKPKQKSKLKNSTDKGEAVADSEELNNSKNNKKQNQASGTKELPAKSRKRGIYEIEEEEFCAAAKCSHPNGNIKWVQCDGCQKWFHMICVGITRIKKKEKYLCNSCTINDKPEIEDVAEAEQTKSSTTSSSSSSSSASSDTGNSPNSKSKTNSKKLRGNPTEEKSKSDEEKKEESDSEITLSSLASKMKQFTEQIDSSLNKSMNDSASMNSTDQVQ